VRTIDSAPAEPVDLLGAAGPSVMKRVAPLALALAAIAAVVWWIARRR
jgi:hypothetical protein